MVGTLMAIDPVEYENLKEYYDLQRKKEYNREQLQTAITEMEGRIGLSMSFDEIWSRIEEKDYQDPPNNWVPNADFSQCETTNPEEEEMKKLRNQAKLNSFNNKKWSRY